MQKKGTMKQVLGIVFIPFTNEMCYRLVERYAVCRCCYYVHAVDPCMLYSFKGHSTMDRVLLVGYLCPDHTRLGREGTTGDDNGRDENNNGTDSTRDVVDAPDESGHGTRESNEAITSSRGSHAGMAAPQLQATDRRSTSLGASNDVRENRATPVRRRTTSCG